MNKANSYPSYPTRAVTISSPQTAARRDVPYKRYTDAELQARRDKGLCYRCDKKYFVGHRCKAKELRLLLASDEVEQDKQYMEVDPSYDINESTDTVEVAELSLNTVVGFTDPGTMKVRGTVDGE